MVLGWRGSYHEHHVGENSMLSASNTDVVQEVGHDFGAGFTCNLPQCQGRGRNARQHDGVSLRILPLPYNECTQEEYSKLPLVRGKNIQVSGEKRRSLTPCGLRSRFTLGSFTFIPAASRRPLLSPLALAFCILLAFARESNPVASPSY